MKLLFSYLYLVTGLMVAHVTGGTCAVAADLSTAPKPESTAVMPEPTVPPPVVADSAAADSTAQPPEKLVPPIGYTLIPRVVQTVYPAADTVTVVVQAEVLASGRIRTAGVIPPVSAFDQRAMAAAWQWVFEPRSETAPPIVMTIPFKFAIIPVTK